MIDKIIKYNDIEMYVDIVTPDDGPMFAIVYFNKELNEKEAKDLILGFEYDIKKAALDYVEDKDEDTKKKIIDSTFTIIEDTNKIYYVEFDELEH